MSQVLFVCPQEGCGAKGFDEPLERPTKLTCRHHNLRMVQHEPGANIPTALYAKPTAVTESGQVINEAPPAAVDSPEALERAALYARYTAAGGQQADRRWGMDRLRSNVEAEEARAAERQAAIAAAKEEEAAEAAEMAALTNTEQEPEEEVTA